MNDNEATDLSTPTTSNTTRRPQAVPSDCRVCGAPALYLYYGAVVCKPCKADLKCPYDGHCDINVNNRHICSYCRLGKCLANGMHSDYFHSSPSLRSANQKRKRANDPPTTTTTTPSSQEIVRRQQPEQFPTLNLLRSDQSTLTADQWTLLSNLIYCYDEHGGMSSSDAFISEQSALPPKLRYKPEVAAPFLLSSMNSAQLLFERNNHLSSLCADDRSVLFRLTYRHVAALGGVFFMRENRLNDNPMFYQSVATVFGQTVIGISKRVVDQLDFDSTLIKLVLAVLCSSTTTYTTYTNSVPVNLINIKTILQIQDMYTEVMWRYLLYRHSHEYAVKCMSRLIQRLFAINAAVVAAHELEDYRAKVNSVVEQTDQSLTLSS